MRSILLAPVCAIGAGVVMLILAGKPKKEAKYLLQAGLSLLLIAGGIFVGFVIGAFGTK